MHISIFPFNPIKVQFLLLENIEICTGQVQLSILSRFNFYEKSKKTVTVVTTFNPIKVQFLPIMEDCSGVPTAPLSILSRFNFYVKFN